VSDAVATISATAEAQIAKCWRSGMSLKSTCLAVQRSSGERVTAEDVRLRFVAMGRADDHG
jgi:acyl-CoA hydrolase